MNAQQAVQVISETGLLTQIGIWIGMVSGTMAIIGTLILVFKKLFRGKP